MNDKIRDRRQLMLLYHMHDRSSFISPLCIVAVSGRVLKTSRNRGELERGGGLTLHGQIKL